MKRNEKVIFLKRLAQGKARIEEIQRTVLRDPTREDYTFWSTDEFGIYLNHKGERFTTTEARAFLKKNRGKFNVTVFESNNSEGIYTEEDTHVITFK